METLTAKNEKAATAAPATRTMSGGHALLDGLIAEGVTTLAAVREKRAKRLTLVLPADAVDEAKLAKLKVELEKYPGTIPVAFELEVQGEATADLITPFKVKVTDDLIAFTERLFGQKCADVG